VLTRTDEYESLWRGAWEKIATAIESFERDHSKVEQFAESGLSLVTLAPASASAQAVHRNFPKNALRGKITFGVPPAIVKNVIEGKRELGLVIDEVAGMCISLLWLPVNWKYVLMALVLFRFFDILKPLFIRRMEKLKGGWGVMMDDVLAGVYANVLAQFVIYFHWF